MIPLLIIARLFHLFEPETKSSTTNDGVEPVVASLAESASSQPGQIKGTDEYISLLSADSEAIALAESYSEDRFTTLIVLRDKLLEMGCSPKQADETIQAFLEKHKR